MPDAWEIAHGLNPTLNDANLDPDHDGMTNLQEYIAGTDPQDPLSYLKVSSIVSSNQVRTLQFLAVSNRFYRVLYRTSLADGLWETLADVPAQPVTHLQTIPDPAGPTNRFYRLVIPQQP